MNDECIAIKEAIHRALGTEVEAQQLLMGNVILEDETPLAAHGPFENGTASVTLIRDAEWRALTLEGVWTPTRVEEWRPREWAWRSCLFKGAL